MMDELNEEQRIELRKTYQLLTRCGNSEYIGCLWTSGNLYFIAYGTRTEVKRKLEEQKQKPGIETIAGSEWIWRNTAMGVQRLFQRVVQTQESNSCSMTAEDIECLRLLTELALDTKQRPS